MGFVDFLLGAVKILIVGVVVLFSGFGATFLFIQGQALVGGILGLVAFVGAMYVAYERGQQRKRI